MNTQTDLSKVSLVYSQDVQTAIRELDRLGMTARIVGFNGVLHDPKEWFGWNFAPIKEEDLPSGVLFRVGIIKSVGVTFPGGYIMGHEPEVEQDFEIKVPNILPALGILAGVAMGLLSIVAFGLSSAVLRDPAVFGVLEDGTILEILKWAD